MNTQVKKIAEEKAVAEESSTPTNRQWLIVALILLVAIAISTLLIMLKPEAEKKQLIKTSPQVEIIIAKQALLSVPVFSQGSVQAATRIKLVAEVSGAIVEMAGLKLNGGYFKQGELLLKIDDEQYLLAISRANAQLAAAEQKLIRVETEARQARFDLQQISRDPSKSSSYALREPQLAEARANLQAAQAELKIAQLQLKRSRVLAPFNGRVINKQVDISQFVSIGSLLADIYATDKVNVRLPLSLSQAVELGLNLDASETSDSLNILLSAEIAGKQFEWSTDSSHIEAELDEKNRLLYLVAAVDLRLSRKVSNHNELRLTPGMFVKAKIFAAKKQLIKLPRRALRYGNKIWRMNAENKLEKISVQLASKDRLSVYIIPGVVPGVNSDDISSVISEHVSGLTAALKQGDKVIVSAIDFPVEAMTLSITKAPQLKIKDNNE